MRRDRDGRFELGFTPPEILSLVRTAVLDGVAAGYEGRTLFHYLSLVCPLLPGSREARIWHREKRRVLGYQSRRREAFRERQTYLAFSP